MNKIRVIVKIFFVFMLIILPFLWVQSARLMVFVPVVDPIERAVAQTFGTEKLVIGSKLKDWVDELGEPDLIVKFEFTYKSLHRVYTEFYWLNLGIAVEVAGEYKAIDSALNSKVNEITIPTQIKLPPHYSNSKYRSRTIIKGTKPVIEFDHLLDIKLNGTAIEDISVEDMRAVYPYYDASNYDYYSIPFPFITHRTWFRCKATRNHQLDATYIDEYCIISLVDADRFSIENYLKFLWAILFDFPFYIITGK